MDSPVNTNRILRRVEVLDRSDANVVLTSPCREVLQ